MARAVLTNGEPTPEGIRRAHHKIMGARTLAAALELDDAEAELAFVDCHLWDCRDAAHTHDWDAPEIAAALAALVERID